MLRCAAYIRVSTEEQAIHGYSLEAQKEALTEFAASNHLAITDYYIDDGYTARKKMSKRKEFQRMIQDAVNEQFDLIIFTKLDRWFRNISDYYKVQDILEAHNIHWKTIYENYDTSTASGRLHINIMLSVAQDEADRTSERIKVVFENKKKRGEVTNGSHPFGFKIQNKKLIPDKDTLPIVKDIFEYYEIYQSIYRTSQMVQERYHLTLCQSTISRILKNRIYIGEYNGIKNYAPPLLSIQQFNRIQNIHPVPRQKKQRHIYLFTGLLRCKECGCNLTANHSTVNYKQKIREYNFYRCKKYTDTRTCCHKKSLNESKLENQLLKLIRDQLQPYTLEITIEDKSSQERTGALQKIQRKMEKLKELYLENLIQLHTYKTDYNELLLQLNRLQETPTDPSVELKEVLAADFSHLYNLLSREEKRILWRTLLQRIDVDLDNELDIYYK